MSQSESEVDLERRIEQHRARWIAKASLREVYREYQERIRGALVPGPILEVGGGSGTLKEAFPQAVSFDLQLAPWLDFLADAQSLPVRDSSFANVILLDVFHHLPHPVVFLKEVVRVLRPGGRLIMIEPNISAVSWIFFRLFHEEPVRLGDDPFDEAPRSSASPYDSNQAIPYLVFVREAERLRRTVPNLRIISTDRFALWAYPLSGGFQSWSLIPSKLVGPLVRIETKLCPLLGPLAGFRLMVVAERGA